MPPKSPARGLPGPLVLALALGVLGPADADALVTVSATRNGNVVEVSGSAILPDGPLVPVAEDVTGDVNAATAQLGGDLTRVSLATQSDGDLVVRWSLASLSGEPNGTLGFARLRFRAGGADYEIGGARNDYTGASTDPGGWLMRCGATTCLWSPAPGPEGTMLISRDVGVTLDFNADFIQATVPVTALPGIVSPGSPIQPYTGSPSSEAATAVGQLEAQNDVDTAEMTESHTYGLTVWLGAGDPAADPESIDYAVRATVEPNNSGFSGSIEAPAGQAVFAKACLGAPTNCAYGRTGSV